MTPEPDTTRSKPAGPIGRRRWRKLWYALGALALLLAIGSAFLASLFYRSTNVPFYPHQVITAAEIRSYSNGEQTRETGVHISGVSAQLLQSMFVDSADRIIDIGLHQQHNYAVQFENPHPGISTAKPFDGVKIWTTPQGHVWSQGNSLYRLTGDLDLFLRSLPAQRMIQLLNKPGPDREEGLRLRAAKQDEYLDLFLASAKSENRQIQQDALRSIFSTIGGNRHYRSWMQFSIDRKPSRLSEHPRAGDVRQTCLDLLKSPPDIASALPIFDCLDEVGDEATAADLLQQISAPAAPRYLVRAMHCTETIVGLPPGYEEIGMCGNSTPQEFAAHHAREQPLRLAARDRLVKWHAEYAALGREQQVEKILTAWNERLLELGGRRKHHYSGDYPGERFRPLLQLGDELLPVLAARQKVAADVVERGGLEFIKAHLTGDCDRELVDQLLASDMHSQTLACNIIAASGSQEWLTQLDELQHTKPQPNLGGTRGYYDWQTLSESATMTLVLCHGVDSLPLIEKARNKSSLAHQIHEYYQTPRTW